MFSTHQILFSYVKVDLYTLFEPHPAVLNRVFTVCAAVLSDPDTVGNLFDVPNEYVDVLGTLKTQTDVRRDTGASFRVERDFSSFAYLQ